MATRYLEQRLAEGLSAHSLQTVRSALRQFFGSRTLADTLTLPRRTRVEITRSRGVVARDRHVNRALVNAHPFLSRDGATGLRGARSARP